MTQADAAHIRSQATDLANEPGMEVLTVPSSLPGVTSWTVFLGGGITVIGKNEAGEHQAILAAVTDENDVVTGLACSTTATSIDACASVTASIQNDLSPRAGLSAASLRPLDWPEVTASTCPDLVDHSLRRLLAELGGERRQLDPRDQAARDALVWQKAVLDCSPDVEPNSRSLHSCFLALFAGDGTLVRGIAGLGPRNPYEYSLKNARRACCVNQPPERQPGALLDGQVDLICGADLHEKDQ